MTDENNRVRGLGQRCQQIENLQGAVVIDLRLDMDLGRFEALLNGASGLPGTRGGRYEKKVKMADAPGQRAGELVRQSMALGGQGALKIGGSVMGCLGVADQDQGLPEFLSRPAATLRHVLEPCDVNRRDAFQRHPVHPPKQYSIQDSPIPRFLDGAVTTAVGVYDLSAPCPGRHRLPVRCR